LPMPQRKNSCTQAYIFPFLLFSLPFHPFSSPSVMQVSFPRKPISLNFLFSSEKAETMTRRNNGLFGGSAGAAIVLLIAVAELNWIREVAVAARGHVQRERRGGHVRIRFWQREKPGSLKVCLQLHLRLLLKGGLGDSLEGLLDIDVLLCGGLKVGDVALGLTPGHSTRLKDLPPQPQPQPHQFSPRR